MNPENQPEFASVPGVNRPIPVDPELTGIAVAARVPGMIADEVCPAFDVMSEQFKWHEYDVGQGMTVPETKVGRTSGVNRLEFGAVERDGSTEDHGLESLVPQSDQNANSQVDPESLATEQLSQVVTLAREIRVSSLVFNPASYLGPQVTTYDNADAKGWWDESSDPLKDIEQARDALVAGANTLTLGLASWRELRKHPKMVKAARSVSSTGEGRLSIAEVRDLLEIEHIHVGIAFTNFAKPGQGAQIARLWGPHASLSYTEKVVKSGQSYSFVATARLGAKIAMKYFNPQVGLQGGNVIRVGERLRELTVAKQAGWLFENAGAAPAG